MFKQQFRSYLIVIAYLLLSPTISFADLHRLVTPPSANKEEVESMLQIVRTEIPKAEVKTVIEKKKFHRLVAGRFNDMASAMRLRSELSKKGITSFISKSKNRYIVAVNSFLSEELAIQEQNRLASKNVTTTIVKIGKPSQIWQIDSVDSYELRDAVYTATIMTIKDVTTTIE